MDNHVCGAKCMDPSDMTCPKNFGRESTGVIIPELLVASRNSGLRELTNPDLNPLKANRKA